MAKVTFSPSGKTVTIEDGTALLDAARAAGVAIDAPCGGEGTCGDCRVRVTEGSVAQVRAGCLTLEELKAGYVLACSSRVTGDLTVEVSDADTLGAVSTGEQRQVESAASEPITRRLVLSVEPPTLDNSFGDLERLERAVARTGEVDQIRPDLAVLRGLATTLRESDLVTATIAHGELVRLQPGDTAARSHGVAVDVGTTTCAIQLVHLPSGRIVGSAARYNRQVSRGLDIISRISYGKTPDRLEELRRLVLETLNELIAGLCNEHAVSSEDIDSATVVGNTTMIHLLLGLDPQHIRLEPYTPTVNRPPLLPANEVGLAVAPRTPVTFAPGVGSYVGGDITAGMLVSALSTDTDAVSLYLDIGTNGEVVVGNREWLMACAASAGPAFEGSGVRCGMRATAGAVERVTLDPATRRAQVSVIGGGPARGICGSGMIDLLAELRHHGLLDPSGKLDAAQCPREVLHRDGKTLGYVVVDAETAADGAVLIDDNDLQNLLRTKAAIYSACSLMLKSVGLGFDDVARVYVAGAFGRYLDLERSIRIGLLPDVPRERFVYLGNAALAGAHALLTSARAREQIVELADRLTYQELNVEPSYMDEYTAALFLPHTDLARFPTVGKRGEDR